MRDIGLVYNNMGYGAGKTWIHPTRPNTKPLPPMVDKAQQPRNWFWALLLAEVEKCFIIHRSASLYKSSAYELFK